MVACAAFAIVLAINGPSEAASGGHSGGFSGGHVGGHPGFDAHRGFEGHHGFEGRHDFDQRFHGGFVYPYFGYYAPYYDNYPAYGYDAPYHSCSAPSYALSSPGLQSCPAAWPPAPASRASGKCPPADRALRRRALDRRGEHPVRVVADRAGHDDEVAHRQLLIFVLV